MNINDLTFGELKQISSLFSGKTESHPFIGKFVLCRCYSAGVHVGELVDAVGENVILKNSRRLWNWKAAEGVALSGVAQNGLKEGKIDTLNPFIALTGVCEIIPMSKKAEASINEK